MRLEGCKWPDFSKLSDQIFVLPLGSLEQHGPHLPVFTDSLIVSHIANRVEQLRSEQLVNLPVQWLGHSPHHRHFGCLSLDFIPYAQMIRGLCASAIRLEAAAQSVVSLLDKIANWRFQSSSPAPSRPE